MSAPRDFMQTWSCWWYLQCLSLSLAREAMSTTSTSYTAVQWQIGTLVPRWLCSVRFILKSSVLERTCRTENKDILQVQDCTTGTLLGSEGQLSCKLDCFLLQMWCQAVMRDNAPRCCSLCHCFCLSFLGFLAFSLAASLSKQHTTWLSCIYINVFSNKNSTLCYLIFSSGIAFYTVF